MPTTPIPPQVIPTSTGDDVRRGAAMQAVIVNDSSNPITVTGGGGGGGGDASAANQNLQITQETLTNTNLGGVTETAPATDTASSGLNGRLQRIAQRLTTILASTLGFSVGSGNVDATTIRIVTAADGALNTNIGALTETAPVSDTASSGLNGRLQRIAQNLTTLIAKFTAGASSVTKNEDAASADGDTGVMVLAMRQASPANTSGTDGDYEPLRLSNGHVWVYADGGVASAATDSGNPVKVGGKYNLTPPTLTDGQRGDLQQDANGYAKVREQYAPGYENNTTNVAEILMKPVAASAYSPSNYKNLGAATKANIKASAGNVYAIYVTNNNAAKRYFQLHNKATAPAATDVPQNVWDLPIGATLVLDSSYFSPSEYFATGIGFAISTTESTFTDSATASDHTTRVRYV